MKHLSQRQVTEHPRSIVILAVVIVCFVPFYWIIFMRWVFHVYLLFYSWSFIYLGVCDFTANCFCAILLCPLLKLFFVHCSEYLWQVGHWLCSCNKFWVIILSVRLHSLLQTIVCKFTLGKFQNIIKVRILFTIFYKWNNHFNFSWYIIPSSLIKLDTTNDKYVVTFGESLP